MKRLLLGLMMLVTATAASAEWTLVGESPGAFDYYVDVSTIRRNGNLVKMWNLLNFKTMQNVAGISYASLMDLSEFDCGEEAARSLTYHNYSGNMRTGKIVYSNTYALRWEPIAPESVRSGMWKIACGR